MFSMNFRNGSKHMAIHKYYAFLRVVELGSISKAAQELGYTQSAVSRMVSDLESEWGLTLIRRSRAGLALSSDGIEMLPSIRALWEKYREMQDRANAIHGLETGFIRIGSCSSVSTQWLPKILKAFEKLYPHIDFRLENMEYSDTEAAIRSGEIDCGFITSPCSDELDFTFLHRDRMLAVLPPEHELAGEEKYPLRRLSSERFIKLRDDANNEMSRELLKLCETLKTPLNTFCDVDDDYSIMAMVESGLGVSVLSELVTERMPFDIVLREFDIAQYRDVGIAVRKGGGASPAVERFVQVVKDSFSNGKLII